MIEQWRELKKTITELRDNDGTGTQQEICEFLANYMDVLEKQMQGPCEDIAKAFQLGLAFGFGEKHDEMDRVIDEIKKVITPRQKTGHCKDCKWWRDSDGAYRRGIKAESQCPINRREVFEGKGYCYMFEPQERSDKK